MDVTLIRSTRLYPDAPYAYAAAGGQAGLVFTAGAMPLDTEGNITAPDDLAAQMRQALANLLTALDDAGVTIRDVLKTNVYVASSDRNDLSAAWREVRAVFVDHDVPGTVVGVAVLACEGQLVEIEAIAAIPGGPEAASSRSG